MLKSQEARQNGSSHPITTSSQLIKLELFKVMFESPCTLLDLHGYSEKQGPRLPTPNNMIPHLAIENEHLVFLEISTL